MSKHSIPDLVANKKRTFLCSHVFVDGHWIQMPFPADITGSMLVSVSPSGTKLAILRPGPSDDKEKADIEVKLVISIPIKNQDMGRTTT